MLKHEQSHSPTLALHLLYWSTSRTCMITWHEALLSFCQTHRSLQDLRRHATCNKRGQRGWRRTCSTCQACTSRGTISKLQCRSAHWHQCHRRVVCAAIAHGPQSPSLLHELRVAVLARMQRQQIPRGTCLAPWQAWHQRSSPASSMQMLPCAQQLRGRALQHPQLHQQQNSLHFSASKKPNAKARASTVSAGCRPALSETAGACTAACAAAITRPFIRARQRTTMEHVACKGCEAMASSVACCAVWLARLLHTNTLHACAAK